MCSFTFLLFPNIYLALRHIAIKPIIPPTSTSHPSKKTPKKIPAKKAMAQPSTLAVPKTLSMCDVTFIN